MNKNIMYIFDELDCLTGDMLENDPRREDEIRQAFRVACFAYREVATAEEEKHLQFFLERK